MFSLGEITLTLIVSILLLGPREVLRIIKSYKKLISQLKIWSQTYIDYVKQAADKENNLEEEITSYIMDLDGKIQRTYDISKLDEYNQREKIDSK